MMVALLDRKIVYLSESVHKHLGLFQVSIPSHNSRWLIHTRTHVYTLTHTHRRIYTPSLTHTDACIHPHSHTQMHVYTLITHTDACVHPHSHKHTKHMHTHITPHHTLTHTTVRTHRLQHVRPDSLWGLRWSKGSHRESWDICYGQTILRRYLHSHIILQFSSP